MAGSMREMISARSVKPALGHVSTYGAGGEGVRDVPPTTRGTRMGDVGWVRRWKGTGGGMGRALGQVPCSPCHLRTPRPPLLTSMRLLS